MIIASAHSLRLVAAQLNANLAGADNVETRDWPREVAHIDLGARDWAYRVSFHVETQRRLPVSNLPKGPRAFWLFAAGVPLALIGIGTVATWVIRAF